MTSLANHRSPTSPGLSIRPSNASLTRPSSRPATPSGLRELANSSSASPPLEPPSGVAYRAFISTWTDGHVAQWLTEAKCAKVAPVFLANHIRGDVVLDLDQAILKEMGIGSVGDRIKILAAVKALRQRCSRVGSAYGIGGANVLSVGPRLMLNNDHNTNLASPTLGSSYSRLGRVTGGEMSGSPSLPNATVVPSSPTTDPSPPNNRISGGTGRRSDRPPPLHISHSAQRDLPQIISGNSNGVLTAGLVPPVSAKSVLTPRPNQTQHQIPTTTNGSGGRDRDKDSSSRQNLPSLPHVPRGQPPNHPSASSGPMTGTSSTSNRSNRSLHPSHGRDHSQSHSPLPSYANDPLPAPPSSNISAIAPFTGDYGLPRGPAPGNLPGGSYAGGSGRASPQPHSRSTTSRSNGDQNLSHKKSGSLSGAVGNLIAGLKGSPWTSGNPTHPYAAAGEGNGSQSNAYPHSPAGGEGSHGAPPPYGTGTASTASTSGYSVGRGPFATSSRSGGSGHHSQQSGGGHGGSPFSLEDLRRRTIKFNLGEPGLQTKQSRTIDISECETGVDVLHTALKKFGKGGGLGHAGDENGGQKYGETEGGGLIVEGWGVFLEGSTGDTSGKPLTEAELLAVCHAEVSNLARDRLILRRVRKTPANKLTAFFGEDPPPPPLQLSPTSPTFGGSTPLAKPTARFDGSGAASGSLVVPGMSPTPRPNAGSKKMYRASTVSIMSGLGAGAGWMATGSYPIPTTITPPSSPGGTQIAGSASMDAQTPTTSQNTSARSPGYGKKLRNFFGQRPPSDIIYTHQQDFFPTAEKRVLERTATARQSIFRGGNSKRISTVSALSSVGIGGGSDDGSRNSWKGKHRSRFSVSSNGSALTPAQTVAAANNPNIPPVPSPTYSLASPMVKNPSGRPRVSIEEPIPRMSISTEDGKSIDLTSDDGSDAIPPSATPSAVPHLLPPVMLGGESFSESLSADFARSPLLAQGPGGAASKRTSFLQELRSKRDRSDTASMLTLDEITEKVESRRQSMMGASVSSGQGSEYGENDEMASAAPSRRQSMAADYPEEDEEEEDETILEEEEEEEEEVEEEADDDDDGYGKATTSTGDKRVIKWIKGALIGAGSFGSVYLGMDAQHGLLMAVKQVSLPTGNSTNEERKKSMLSALEREIALLKELQHEYIVQYLDSSIDDMHLNIFLEYVPGGSVATLLKNYGAFEESLVSNWVRQILIGLNYLHERDIVHRDIKGANILVDNRGGIKISDFGISKKMEDGARGNRASLQGSVFWMAPEVVKQSGHSSKADIWSVGCVVVEMLTGEHPYPKSSQMQAIFKIGSYAKPDTPPEISAEAEDFLNKTFEIDHNARPSAAELLHHVWL